MEVQSSANVDYGSLAEVLVEQVSLQAEPLSVAPGVATRALVHWDARRLDCNVGAAGAGSS